MPWKPLRPDDVPPFMCVGCHDWACNCRSPFTVKRYTFGHTPRPPMMGATVYERGYMLPHDCHLDKNNNLVAKMPPVIRNKQRYQEEEVHMVTDKSDQFTGGINNHGTEEEEEQATSSRNRFLKQKHQLASGQTTQYDTYNWSLSHQPTSATSSAVTNATFVKSEEPEEDTETSRLEEKYNSPQMMEAVLASKPVSVKGAFLVSGPHWASKGHTQQWPWRGGVKCRLWSTDNQFNQTTPACHNACWNTRGMRPKTARA